MLLSEITHKATLKSIETNNLDISIFENIYELRKHLKQIIRLKFRATHGIVKNQIRPKVIQMKEYNQYYKEYYMKNKDRIIANNRKRYKMKQILKMTEKNLPSPQNF